VVEFLGLDKVLTIDFLHCVEMSQKQGDAQLKKGG